MQKLLVLQDRDSRCDMIKRQLDAIPGEISSEESAIRALHEQLAAGEQELKELEVRRMDIEGDVEAAEAMILKYKTQQMQVKKNEEYTALEREIGNLKDRISGLEDAELLLLEETDNRKAVVEALRKSVRDQQATLEAHIQRLRQNFDSFAAELEEARSLVAGCEGDIDTATLQQYRYVKSQVKRPPYVVALEDGRCQGCHLKVSGEVESEAKRGTGLVRCDSCGRILFYDR